MDVASWCWWVGFGFGLCYTPSWKVTKRYKVMSQNLFTTRVHSLKKRKVLDYGSAMAILQSRQRLLTMNITDDIACQECGKFFSDESGFKRHFRQYHKQYEKDCHICDKKFYTRFMLKNHIGKIHSTANCDICDKIVVKSALSNHTQTHQERKFSVKDVIMFTPEKTAWQSTLRLVEQILCESEKN